MLRQFGLNLFYHRQALVCILIDGSKILLLITSTHLSSTGLIFHSAGCTGCTGALNGCQNQNDGQLTAAEV